MQESHYPISLIFQEHAIEVDKNEREFDQTSSSSCTSDESHHGKKKVPLKKSKHHLIEVIICDIETRSVMALKAIVNEDYEDYVKSFAGGINSSIVPVVTDGEEADEKAVEKRNIKQRTSHEFDIAFDGRKSLGSPTILEEDEDARDYGERSEVETTERNYQKQIKKEESSSSSAEMEFNVDNEFSKSFQALMSPELQQVLMNVNRLKQELKKQVKQCVKDVQNDLRNFDKSVKLNIAGGSLKDIEGEKTLENTKQAMKLDIETLLSKLRDTKTKFNQDGSG